MKYQVLFSLKSNEKVFMNVVCCSCDGRFKGYETVNFWPGSVAQLVRHLTNESEVLGLIPGLATYFCFSFC